MNVEQWKEVLGNLPSPEGTPPEYIVAQRVLNDLDGYRRDSRYRPYDAEELAAAMTAWAEMNAELNPRYASAETPAVYRDGRNMDGTDA